jgi:CPA1 family monovalent cation:H+ antiporter
MSETQFAITVLLALLMLASTVAMATRWIPIPYTLLLVIVGVVVSPMHFLPVVHISPELILLIFLPALLFEAAWNLELDALRKNLVPVVILAVVGVIVSVGVVGAILHLTVGLRWSAALLFGAMISATDPVSVLALFRRMGLPGRLTAIIENESLFNDGTSIAVFQILLGIAMGTTVGPASELAALSLRSFLIVSAGGMLVGAVVGILASTLTAHFDDQLLEITLTTTSAYGVFLVADALHVSPVIAVLFTGLVIGNYGRSRGMSATTELAVTAFWGYAAFVVNSLVFLLIGLETHITVLAENAAPIAWAVAAMLVGRGIAVYGLMPIGALFGSGVPRRWQHVLVWGGLRGSLSIALVLSLPDALAGRQRLVAMVFGTVTFSLLCQGLTLSPLLKLLRLRGEPPSPEDTQYELLNGLLLADTAARVELDEMRRRGLVTDRLYEALKSHLDAAHPEVAQQLAHIDASRVRMAHLQFRRMQRRLLDVKKARLEELRREGLLTDGPYERLTEIVDQEQAGLLHESDRAADD